MKSSKAKEIIEAIHDECNSHDCKVGSCAFCISNSNCIFDSECLPEDFNPEKLINNDKEEES